MTFSLSAKPPKPKPKKAKEKTFVRSSGRGGSGNIKKKKIPKTPPNGADLVSIGSTTSPALNTSDATSSHLSRVASGITATSKTHSSHSTDMGETEDKIKAPAGREILSAKHRKLYSGRGGAGNAHKLLADDVVYEGVLLHEQGIVQAYNEERREREAKSTGRGGSGNIRKKKKSAYGSDSSSTRTRSSGRSWGSIARRYRNGIGTNTQSSLSLSSIPSLQVLPNNDTVGSLDKAAFKKLAEENELHAAGSSSVLDGPVGGQAETVRQPPPQGAVSADMDSSVASASANAAVQPTSGPISPVTRQPFFNRTPASKPLSPSAISSGSWIANGFRETTSVSALSLSRPSNTPSPGPSSLNKAGDSPDSSTPPLSAHGKSTLPNSRLASQIPTRSSPPVLNITISPSTTPTLTSAIRRIGSSNEHNEAHTEILYDQMAAVRSRQANRNVSIYDSHDSLSSSASEDPIALYTAPSQESLESTLPYLNAPISSTPTASSTMQQASQQRPPSRPLPSSPSNSNTLELPVSAVDTARHSRQMSSSSTSGSDLDLSRYNFPDAPGHEPRVLARESPVPLHMVMDLGDGQATMKRRPSVPLQIPPPPLQSPPPPPLSPDAPPPARVSRAPVQPGAYQAALRSVMDDVPDVPPPTYQPRASRRYPADSPQGPDYPDPSTPRSYTPYRVASPGGRPLRSPTDSPSQRPSPKGNELSPPLSEAYTPSDGVPIDRYPTTDRNENVYPNEKARPAANRTEPSRKPSDPYQRLIFAAAKNPSPDSPRRGSSSYAAQQTLSPHLNPNYLTLNVDQVESPTDYSSSDFRSRPPSQAFSTYTRGTRYSTWGASQATATAVDHHETDFQNIEDDDKSYYSSMFEGGDVDVHEDERGRAYKEAHIPKGMRAAGREPEWLQPNFTGPPVPQMPKQFLATKAQISEPAISRSPSRQLPTPPMGPTATPPPRAMQPHFPGGMGWDELHRPVPRKLSKMEKALLRRVEFGAVAAADIATIPLA